MAGRYIEIVKDRHTQLRAEIAERFYTQKIDEFFLLFLADELAKMNPDARKTIEEEKTKLLDAIKPEGTSNLPNLEIPETATLWGATLAYVAQSAGKEIQETKLWKQVVSSPLLVNECTECSYELYRSFRKIGFGQFKVTLNPSSSYPSIAYYCDPEARRVNLDPVWMLIMGMEKARAAMMHEVGHALGSLDFTPKMQEIRDEIKIISEKPKRNKEDYIRQVLLDFEWQQRFKMVDECENSYANRFMANRGKSGSEDYGASMNYVEAVIGQIQNSVKRMEDAKENRTAETNFSNVKRAVRYSFFKNNDFLDDTPNDWRSIGVEPDWIQKLVPEAISGWDALQDLCSSCKALEDLQPRSGDMVFGAEYFSNKNKACWEKRMDIMDEIFERFVLDDVQEMKQGLEEQLRDKLENESKASENDNTDKSPTTAPPPPPPSSPSEEQEDESSSCVSGECEQGDSGGDNDSKNETPENETGDDTQASPSAGSEEEVETPEDELDDDTSGGASTDSEEGLNSEDLFPDVPIPPETPQEAEDTLDDTNDEVDDSATVENMVKELMDKEDSSDSDDNTNEENTPDTEQEQQTPNKKINPEEIKNQSPSDLSKVKGEVDLNEYDQVIAPHPLTIKAMSKQFKKLRETNIITKKLASKKRSLFPKDGNASGHDVKKGQRTLQKIYNGSSVKLNDFKQFKIEEKETIEGADIDIEIILDISGSLAGEPLERALATACCLYEGARKEKGVNVNITAMGQPTPMAIARMGQSSTEISRNILRVLSVSGQAQDFLSPALKDVFERNAVNNAQHKKQDIVGVTHVFIVSDGYFSDREYASVAAKDVAENCRYTTLDFILIEQDIMKGMELPKGFSLPEIEAPEIEGVIKRHAEEAPRRRMGCIKILKASQMHDALIKLTKSRLKSQRKGATILVDKKIKENQIILNKWSGYNG